jgi:hypothetical protein
VKVSPKITSTKIGSESWEWIPQDFECFLEELKAIEEHCHAIRHIPIYRGQSDRKWLLDSTFVRSCKQIIFGISPLAKLSKDFRLSPEHQQIVGNLFLFKFGRATIPSQELYQLQNQQGIDAWFEWMKRLQQYSEEDKLPLKGTFLMDWTRKPEVAVYFSNKNRIGEGAVWISDITATGKTLQMITVGEMLDKMHKAIANNESLGIPLMFHPKKEIASERASNQGAVYFAQMDLRVDLSEIWSFYENEKNIDENIFIKLVLPATVSNEECAKWLEEKGITRNFLFPDEPINEE